MPYLWKDIRDSLLALFYPVQCVSCGNTLLGNEAVLCTGCLMQLPKTGFNHIHHNIAFLKFTGRTAIQYAAVFSYFTKQGMLQRLLHRLKYHNRQEIGILLGRLFATEIKDLAWVRELDAIIPLPLHKKKLQLRGFNQSAVIAEAMAVVLGIPYRPGWVIRHRNTSSQTNKTRQERIENVAGAFSIPEGLDFEGKNILLVDDVLTTGATLESCANTLLQGNCKVSIATIGMATE
jgi:ComF family protein